MRIGFIGAGKVGTAFGRYLKNKGFHIIGYYSRTIESSKRAADLTESVFFESADKLINEIDIIFITTNDDEISKVCEGLAEGSLLKPGQILVHMSGAASSGILNSARARGCYIYSLHPLQAFAHISKAVEDLSKTVFSIEGDSEKICVIEEMLRECGNDYFIIDKEQKSLYHATACVVSNYLVTLMDYGLSLFEAIDIDKDEGYKALYPLIEGTIKNIYNLGTEEALTGPIARGDIKTIEGHIESLNKICPDKLELYKIIGDKTLELAAKGKLYDKNKIIEIKKCLKG